MKVGVSAWEIEQLAVALIKKSGAEASFSKVPKYHWATCININEGVVHGIPKKEVVFKKGDVVSVDVGLYYKGFHTDTSFSKGLGVDAVVEKFLNVGKQTLSNAIAAALPGARIYDISQRIETSLKEGGCNPVKALVGHGVGRQLHEDPLIPQFVYGKREDSAEVKPGMVLAIEVIYTLGDGEIAHDKDGWTIVTRDGTISALYEDSLVITEKGHFVVTR